MSSCANLRGRYIVTALFLAIVSHAVAERRLVGEWEAQLDGTSSPPWPLQAHHAALLKDGRVLCVDTRIPPNAYTCIWDPATGAILKDRAANFGGNQCQGDYCALVQSIMCSGNTQLPDGRILFVGGGGIDDAGIPDVFAFDASLAVPNSTPFVPQDNMRYCVDAQCTGNPDDDSRWYPSLTTLADGRVLVTAGRVINPYRPPPPASSPYDWANMALILDVTQATGSMARP